MSTASIKKIIPCKKEQLVEMVLDIEKYPEFVPFCLASHVYEKNNNGDHTIIIADLTIGKGPFKDTYKSDVRFDKEKSIINVTNIGGPLNHLENKWTFIESDNCTEILFDIDFEIENKFLNIVMTKSFQYGLNKIADAFQKRAHDLYQTIEN